MKNIARLLYIVMFAGKMHLLARQLATTRVEPEEHWLPAVTVPGPIMMMRMVMIIVLMTMIFKRSGLQQLTQQFYNILYEILGMSGQD